MNISPTTPSGSANMVYWRDLLTIMIGIWQPGDKPEAVLKAARALYAVWGGGMDADCKAAEADIVRKKALQQTKVAAKDQELAQEASR